MGDYDEKALQNPDNWDLESAEVVKPESKPSRAVFSVAFPRDDMDVVSSAARNLGVTTSAFIREAAVEKARGESEASVASLSGTSGSIASFVFNPAPETRGFSKPCEIKVDTTA